MRWQNDTFIYQFFFNSHFPLDLHIYSDNQMATVTTIYKAYVLQ